MRKVKKNNADAIIFFTAKCLRAKTFSNIWQKRNRLREFLFVSSQQVAQKNGEEI